MDKTILKYCSVVLAMTMTIMTGPASVLAAPLSPVELKAPASDVVKIGDYRGHYRGHRGRGFYRGGGDWHGSHYGLWAPGAAFIAGAIIGGVLAGQWEPQYRPRYRVYDRPRRVYHDDYYRPRRVYDYDYYRPHRAYDSYRECISWRC